MSKIAKNLADVAEVTIKRGEDRQEFLNRAIKAVSELSDKDWDALDKVTQDWFNAAADAKNAKAKTLPDFPDLEDEEPKTSRRSSSKGDDDAKTPGTKEIDVAKVKTKMAVKVLTKRGKELSGVVVEVDDEVLVLKMGNGDEEEVDVSRIDKVFALDTGSSKDKDDEPADPIKVGAEVIVTTKRGKEVTGKIVEMDDEVIVLKTADGEEELDRSRVGAIEVVGGKGSKDEEPKTSRRSSSKGDDKGDDKDDGKTKRTRSSNEGGVSVGQRIKELIADDLEATEAEIGKKLAKEGLEFRENTLKLNYADAHKFIEILKAKKMLKV